MENKRTIKIFLLEGDPAGAKKVGLDNWSGIAYVIPRTSLEVIKARTELAKPCVYFLFGGTSTSPEVYIGEAENFQKRIPQHQSKEFWNVCIVFSSTDDNLSKAHVKFLEAEFVADCTKANRAKMMNRNDPERATLSEEDESGMYLFKNNIKLILSTLGYNFHYEIAAAKGITGNTYFIQGKPGKKINATGVYSSEGMMVLAGSQIAKDEAPSIHGSFHNMRAEKITEGVMTDAGSYYELKQNIVFSKPSGAASFVVGRNANGWQEWKNSKGKTIHEVERKSLQK